MGCLFAIMLLAGPRAAIFLWWLINPGRFDAAFDTSVWPVLGFLILPWTTLMFLIVAPRGNVSGFDVLFLGLAVLADIASLAGGRYGGRRQMATY
jgi:hypothetical protein